MKELSMQEREAKYKRERLNTITVKTFIDRLSELPPNMKVYMSVDPEGNSYSTFNSDWLYGITEDKKSIIIQPYGEGLEYEEIDKDWDKDWDKQGD